MKNIICYYKEIYNRKDKSTIINVVIKEDDNIVHKDFFRLKGTHKMKTSEKALWRVFEILNSLALYEYKNDNCKYILRISNILIYNALILSDLEKLKDSPLYSVRKHLDMNNNWYVQKENFKTDFFKKHYRLNVKRKINYSNKLIDLRINNLLNKGYISIVFFDLEMNCINGKEEILKHGETISLGAVKYDILTGKRHKFYSLIKPDIISELTDKCIKITGLSQADINSADNLKNVMYDFNKWVGSNKTLFASWGTEDIKVIKYENLIKGYRSEEINRIKNNYTDFQEEFNRYYLKEKNRVSLKNATELLNLNFSGCYHNALDDAINLSNIYMEYKKYKDGCI